MKNIFYPPNIAVFQEICQSVESGHYTSKMYDFDFSHNDSGIGVY